MLMILHKSNRFIKATDRIVNRRTCIVNEKQEREPMTAVHYLVVAIVDAVALFPSFVDAKPRSVDDKTKRERFTDI